MDRAFEEADLAVPEADEAAARPSPRERLAAQFPALSLEERLGLVCRLVPARKVFTTSLGLEDQAITHAIFSQRLPIEVVTLDTGRLFPETYDLWAATEERYARRIKGLSPDAAEVEALIADQGINGFRYGVDMRKACCFVRMVVPLTRGLGGAAAWITGLRGDQSLNRATMVFAEQDSAHRVLKVNPLLDWSREDVAAYVKAHDIPYNPLHDKGFLSIGCAPCTRAVKPGEPERAGRWWWEEEGKKECGLHEAAPAEAA
jgi:phosphoadenosine phosphosulfate reductase